MRPHGFIPASLLALSLAALAEPTPPAQPVPSASTPLAVFRSNKERPDAVAFSPDGKHLLSASGFELLLWDVTSAKPIRRLKIPDMYRDFTTCAFSLDGKTILAGSNDGKVATWETESGKLKKVIDSEDWMYDCEFTPDRLHVLSVYQSGRVNLREVSTGKALWEKRNSGVELCTISADGKRAVTASEFGMNLWDVVTGEILRPIRQQGSESYYKTITLSRNGSLLACPTGASSSDFLILNTRSGEVLRTFKGHTNSIRFLGFSPDDSMIASTSSDNTLKLWDSATGKLIRTFSGHRHDVLCAAFLADGSKILSASEDLSMKLWDCLRETIPPAEHAAILAAQTRLAGIDREDGYIEPLLTIAPNGHKFGIEDSAFSPDGKRIISCSNFVPVIIHDASTGAILTEYSGHPRDESPMSCIFSPDGMTALSAGQDETLKLWDARSGKTLRTFEGHSSYVPDAVFSPDGSRILSVSWDKTVRFWQVSTGKQLFSIDGHEGDLNDCAYFPDGKSVLVTSDDKTVRIYQSDDGKRLRTLQPGYEATAIAISPDGKRLFTGSAYAAIQTFWDLETGKATRLSGPANDYVHSAAFSPDGKWLVTGSLDRGIRIRNGETGAFLSLVRSHSGHSNGVESVSFSPDGTRVLTGSDDGSLKTWDFQRLLDSRSTP